MFIIVSQQHLPFLMINPAKQVKDVKENVNIEERKESKTDLDKNTEQKLKKTINRDGIPFNRKSDSKLIQVDNVIDLKSNEKIQNIFTSILLY